MTPVHLIIPLHSGKFIYNFVFIIHYYFNDLVYFIIGVALLSIELTLGQPKGIAPFILAPCPIYQ